MKGQTMQAACYSLGILCTFNRPRTSNDNAHMEASFKLLKHGRVIENQAIFTPSNMPVRGVRATTTGIIKSIATVVYATLRRHYVSKVRVAK